MAANLGGVLLRHHFHQYFLGITGEYIGWIRQVRWFGCLGMAISSLTFYYLPVYAGHNFAVALIPAIMLGIFVAAFVPMTAVFPTLEPHHKGARSPSTTSQPG
jgi:hypothetical protein